MSRAEFPEHEAPEKRSVAARDVAPRFLAPTEDGDVSEAHDILTKDVEDAHGENRMLGEVIAVVHGMGDEWHNPEDQVDRRIDEQEPELSLNGSSPALHGLICHVFSNVDW